MAWTDLKAAIAAVIKTNGTQAITGALLQSSLNSIIDQVGANSTFKGVAVPSTVPGTPDGPQFYLASDPGVYSNFNGIAIGFKGVHILSNQSGAWTLTTIKVDNYYMSNIISPNAYIESGTALTDVEVGILNNDGSVNSTITDYRTYAITNNDSGNRGMFIYVDSNIQGIPVSFSTMALFDGTTLIGQSRVYGKHTIMLEPGFTVKISLMLTGLVVPIYSFTKVSILDKINQVNINTGKISLIDQSILDISSRLVKSYIEQTGVAESQDGYYNPSGGFAALTGYKSKKYTIDPNTLLYATAIVDGGVVALARYYDSEGTLISSEKTGMNGTSVSYTREKLNPPVGAVTVGITSRTNHLILYIGEYGTLEDHENRIEIIEETAKDYTLIDGTAEAQGGFYSNTTGTFIPTVGWLSKKFPIQNGVDYYVTSKTSGSPTSLAVYYSGSGVFLGQEKPGIGSVRTYYTREKLNLPPEVGFVGLTKFVADDNSTEHAILESYGFAPVTKTKVEEIVDLKLSNYWIGKKIVWFGTSIPKTGYPQIVGTMLGATMVNEAQASSMARRGKIDVSDGYGWTGLAWQNVGYALCQTIAEKTTLINDWNTWKTLLSNTPPTSLDAPTQALFLDCSFENRLYRHLASKGGTDADLYVFDHGHNDNLVTDTDEQFKSVPASSRDKNTFIGSMNFIIDEILKNNPRARICFIGHYENARKTRVSEAQEVLAAYWDFPLIKMWEKTGWTQQQVQTTGYWSGNVWYPSGGTLQTLTLTQVWMRDDLHPSSTATKEFLANILAESIKQIR